MSFKTQIEELVGTTDSDSALLSFLNATTKEIVSVVPPSILQRYATNDETTVDDTGYDSTDQRILSLNRAGYEAKEVSLGKKAAVVDANSIHYATKRSPVFYFDGEVIYTKPMPSSTEKLQVKYIDYPTLTAVSDTDIPSLPETAHYAVVLGAALKFLIRTLGTIKGELPSDLNTSDFTPTVSPPDITASPYNEFTTVVYDSTGTATTLAAVSDASSSVINLSFVDDPAYTPASITVDFGSGNDFDNLLGVEEDAELASIELQKQAQLLGDYQADIQNNLNEYNESLAVYQAKVQAKVQDAQIDSAESISNMQKDLAISQANAQIEESRALQNKIQETQEIIANNNALLSKFGAEMQNYQSSFGAEMQLYTTNLQKEIQEFVTNSEKVLKKVQIVAPQIASIKELYAQEMQRLAGLK